MNWPIKTIEEVCSLMTGGTPSKSKPEYFNGGNIKWLVSGDIHEKEIFDCKGRITELGLKSSNAKFLPENSVMIALNGQGKTRGSVALLRTKATCNQSLVSINPKDHDELLPEFLFQYLDGKYDFIRKMTGDSGNDRRGLNMPLIKSIKIPIPLIPEQKRIVAILDQAFADIDQARANAEQNLNNARELFESYLQQVFSQHTDGWEYKKWGELCDFVRGPFGGSLKKSMFKEEGFVVYEQKHAIHNHFNQLRYFIDEEKFNEMKRFEVKAGDIIMSCSGVTLGRVAVIPEGIPRGIINQALLKLTPKKEMSDEFLKHWLRSKIFQDVIFKHSGGAAIPNVPSAKIMKEIVIPLPSLAEQKEIVKQIELLLEKTSKLKSIYQKKIDDLDELKKSILQKAFSGELTRTVKKAESNVIPFPTKVPNISTTDLHAGILALAYQSHEQATKPQQFGHVKAEKIAHLAEAMLGIELDRKPIQDAAGPNDYPHFKSKVEPRAKKAGFFTFKGSKETGYILQKGSRFDDIADKAHQALSDAGYLAAFDNLMQLLVKMDTEKAEIFATVYAAWNNLLLDKVDITDEAIVQAARENWHTSKLKIPRERFFNAIAWMRAQGVIPTGKGKYVQANGGGK